MSGIPVPYVPMPILVSALQAQAAIQQRASALEQNQLLGLQMRNAIPRPPKPTLPDMSWDEFKQWWAERNGAIGDEHGPVEFVAEVG